MLFTQSCLEVFKPEGADSNRLSISLSVLFFENLCYWDTKATSDQPLMTGLLLQGKIQRETDT